MAISNPESFWLEARRQALDGKLPDFEAHHVVYRQHLRDLHLPEWDTRNARAVTLRNHQLHHDGFRIRVEDLTDENIAYAFEVMGGAAYDYLRRYYRDNPPDPRLEAHLGRAA